MKKKIFLVFLTTLILAIVSLAVFAGDTTEQPTGEIADATGTKGGSVTVNLNVTNNPGIAGAIFKVSFDSDVLTPKKVEAGSIGFDVVAYNTETAGEVTVVLLEAEGKNVTSDGTAASVTFDVAEDAEVGTYDIDVTCETDGVADEDLQTVNLYTANGSVEIKDYIVGDVDGNGSVNSLDRNALARHLADWPDYTENDISMAAADVDGNGSVNSLDRNILARHLADWPGYETLPKTNN